MSPTVCNIYEKKTKILNAGEVSPVFFWTCKKLQAVIPQKSIVSPCLGHFKSFGMCTPCPAPPCTALHPSALRTGHGQLLYLQAPWGHDDGLWPRL